MLVEITSPGAMRCETPVAAGVWWGSWTAFSTGVLMVETVVLADVGDPGLPWLPAPYVLLVDG
ncbi:hypothetical protein ACIP9H_40190 [Streptomyces sp. NPDC088732]|uniref:hypothetical protein n=1 Tax=Streptomyces sp. NPDC088732 TaxID=3365879 RepID=UPI003827AA6C